MGVDYNYFTGDLMPTKDQGIPGYTSTSVPISKPAVVESNPNMPANLSFTVNPVLRKAKPSMTPEQVFALYSTAFSAPFRTYYVDRVSGSDANAGTDPALPLASWTQMQTLANATGQPCKAVIVRTGTGSIYGREHGPAGGSGLVPATVDMAFVARGGRIDLSTHNTALGAGAYVAIAGWPGCFEVTVPNCHMVTQRTLDAPSSFEWAGYRLVFSAEQIRTIPGSYYVDTAAGKVYLHTIGNVTPDGFNVRILRPVPLFRCTNDVNIGFFCETGNDWWSFMGGSQNTNNLSSGGACIEYLKQSGAAPAQRKVLVTHRVTTAHGYRGFATDGLHGLHYADTCRGFYHGTDWINSHIVRNNIDTLTIAFNGFCRYLGGPGVQSAQGFTLHDKAECQGWSLCNDYDYGSGALIRNIGGSVCASDFDTFGYDRGDISEGGGTVDSVSIQIDGAGTRLDVRYPLFKNGGNPVDVRALSGTVCNILAPDGDVKYGGAGTITVTTS